MPGLADDDDHTIDNLFVGLLRTERSNAVGLLGYAGADLGGLRRQRTDRLVPAASADAGLPPSLDAVAEAVLATARELAQQRSRAAVGAEHLLAALVARDDGPVVELLRSSGAKLDSVREACLQSL